MNVQGSFEAKSKEISFGKPPIVESALGIQFELLTAFKTIHFGAYFPLIAERFPIADEQPRLEPIIERFPRPRVVPMLRLESMPTPQRFVFMDKDGTSLIQVQPDRFGFNWRKATDEAAYPRYEQNAGHCLEEFSRFEEFCIREGIGRPEPSLCEVVYVNHILPERGESVIDLFYKVFPVFLPQSGALHEAQEVVAFNRVYAIDRNRGRLYAEASIGNHSEKGNFILLKMTARTLVGGDDCVRDALSLAHDWVVTGFVELTDANVRKERWREQE